MTDEVLDVAPEVPVVDPVVTTDPAPVTPSVEDAPAVTDDQSEPKEGGEPATPEDAPAKQKSGFQRRIDELTREKYEAQRAAKDAVAQAEEYQRQAIQAQTPQQGQDPFPTLEQAGWDEGTYQKEVQGWYQRQAKVEYERQEYTKQVETQQKAQVKQAAEMQTKVSEAVTRYPDFVAKIQNPELPNLAELNPAAFEAVVSSDKFAEVAYYLANNPTDLYALESLNPLAAVRKIVQLETKLSTSAQSPTTPPPPPPKGKVGGTGKSNKAPKDMSINEFMDWRNKADKR